VPRDIKLRRSVAQEKRTAERYKGSRSPQSGAGWVSKNDVRTDTLLIENKRTDNKSSITIKAKDLEDLDRNACREGRQAWFQFDLNGRSYVILREGFAMELAGLD
jgi:hypothetical protein